MPTSTLKARPDLNDRLLKTNRLIFDFTIVGDATPANKTHRVDLPSAVLRTQGKTAEADAIEDLSASFTTAEDTTNGVFGVLVQTGPATAKACTLTEITSVSASEAVTLINGTNTIGIDITATGLDLETETATFRVFLDYVENQ